MSRLQAISPSATSRSCFNTQQAGSKRMRIGRSTHSPRVRYNRGPINPVRGVEGIRTAMKKFGNKPMTGEQVRWGFENLNLSVERIKELGFEGMLKPIKLTCQDHQGADEARVQQWDGKNWKIISDYYKADLSILDPMVKDAATKYAVDQ